MLARVILNQEVRMSEQGQLFSPRVCVWVERMWARSPVAVRRECIAILAEMGRATLAPRPAVRSQAVRVRSGEANRARTREARDER